MWANKTSNIPIRQLKQVRSSAVLLQRDNSTLRLWLQ